MLSKADVVEIATDQLLPLYKTEKKRLDRIDLWLRWRHEDPTLPRQISRELRSLLELARSPWLAQVVRAVVQGLEVDGYGSPDGNDEGPWRTWQGNDFDNRQKQIYQAAVAYGYAFNTILPGEAPDGSPMSVMRGVSPRKMVAVYADEVEDDWPMFAMKVNPAKARPWTMRMFDDEQVYSLAADSSGSNVIYITADAHDSGECPVARYANSLDLDGRLDGEVEPYISTAARINKTVFDRLLTQHYSSWKVRTVAGMEEPDREEDARRKKLKLRQDDILIAEDKDTKFGTLDETPLDGFIAAREADLKDLAGTSQTPLTAFGDVANLSADAIAELRDGLTQKIGDRKKSFGKSHEQSLRMAAYQEGNDAAAQDVMAHVTWADTQNRSLAQAADALGKMATMLGVPPQALWSRIPGVSSTEVTEWEQMLTDNNGMAKLTQLLETQIAGAGNANAG